MFFIEQVKCGAQYPTCSRCELQHLDCVYDVEAPFVGGGEDVKDLVDALRDMQKQLKNLESDFRRHQTVTVKILKKASSSQPSPVNDIANSVSRNFNLVNDALTTDTSDSSAGHESDISTRERKRHRSETSTGFDSDITRNSESYSDTNSLISSLMRSSVPPGLYPAGTLRIVFSERGLAMEINSTSLTELYAAVLNSLTQLHVDDAELKQALFKKEDFFGHAIVTRKKPGPTFGENPMNEFFAPENWGKNWGDSLSSRPKANKYISHLLTDRLIDVYFKCYNMRYPFIDQDEFMRAYRQHLAHPLLVNGVCALIVKHAFQFHNDPPVSGYEYFNTDMVKSLGEHFYHRARAILDDKFDDPQLAHVQALVLCAYYEMVLRGPQRSHLLYSLAVYMLLDMDIYSKIKDEPNNEHYLQADSASLHKKEMMKRVFWFVYITDFQFAFNSGDPAMIDDTECKAISLPAVLPTYDKETKYSIVYFAQDIRLTRIRKTISKTIYADSKSKYTSLSTISTLENTLTAFYDLLPSHLKYSREKRYPQTSSFWLESMLILNLDYYSYWIELHQIFLPKMESYRLTTDNQDAVFPDPSPLLSLHISTMAANTVTSIIQCLIDHNKCYFDLHAVSASSDIHITNLESDNEDIRETAKINLAKNLNFVKRSGGYRIGLKGYLLYVEKLENALADREMSLELDMEIGELNLDGSAESQWDDLPDSDFSPFLGNNSSENDDFEWIDNLSKIETHHLQYVESSTTKTEIEALSEEELYVLLTTVQQQDTYSGESSTAKQSLQ